MPKVTIENRGCRECSLCVDICPTQVIEAAKPAGVVAAREQDCIGCTSCEYICPSRCIKVSDFTPQRPFHHMDLNAALVAKLLQKQAASTSLTEADLDEALRDVSVRLKALSDSIVDTMGRGQKAVGRKAGTLAASHLPEMYEAAELSDVLARMKHRFKGSFDFDATIESDAQVTMVFPCCALGKVVESNGEQIGTAVLCQTFHEYWAGLLGAFTNKNYAVEMSETGKRCTMKLAVR